MKNDIFFMFKYLDFVSFVFNIQITDVHIRYTSNV